MKRRNFMAYLGGASCCAWLGPILLASCTSKTPSGGGGNNTGPIELDLTQSDYAALNTIGGAAYVTHPTDDKPIIVHRTSQTAVAAFSSRCTHLACQVGLPVGNVAQCPCHQSRFDGEGNVTTGPATANLAKFTASLAGDIITITV